MRLGWYKGKLLAAFALALLAGCGSGTPGGQSALAGLVAEYRATRGQVAGGAPELTRAQIDALNVPLLEITVLETGARAILALQADTRGVEVWRSADDMTFAFRDGLLVATRGTGGDILSAYVAESAQALRSGGGSVRRQITLIDGRGGLRRLDLACELKERGGERLVVAGESVETRAFQEACSDAEGVELASRFWVDRTGRLRRSEQWAGQELGYLLFTRLN